MISQIAQEFANMNAQRIPSRRAMDIVEASEAPAMEKGHARSLLMCSDSRLTGSISPHAFARDLENRVSFWKDMGSRRFESSARWSHHR